MEDKDLKIICMQNNLGTLRKIAGWTTEQLANKLDVSKQTIYNLENKENHTKMKLSQYLALKVIFDEEIKNNPQNELLKKAKDVLIDNPDSDENMYKKKKMYIDTLAAAKYAGKKDNELIEYMGMLVGSLIVGLSVGTLFDKFFEKRRK